MVTSIPYDPSLILGQVIELERIEDLKNLANFQKPLDEAHERLSSILRTIYKLNMVQLEMENIGVDSKTLNTFKGEIETMENILIEAATYYAATATTVLQNVEDEMNAQDQKTISMSIESPMDYGRSEVTQFPLSFDSLEFDVQYVRNELMEQSSKQSAKQSVRNLTMSASVPGAALNIPVTKVSMSSDMQRNVNSSMMKQFEKHSIEGTIVISANATHKNASIISPFILDPFKAVTAWNYTYPDEIIRTEPSNILKAALEDYDEDPSEKKTLNILSGCAKTSTFVGFVHILKDETTDSSQSASSMANQVRNSLEIDAWQKSVTGQFGGSSNVSNTQQSLSSASFISNHANICCRGIIPSIVCSDMTATIQKLAPDAARIMEGTKAIANASNGDGAGNDENTTEEGKRGAQYQRLNSEFLNNTVRNLSAHESEANKVIDTNSMMTALEDFINKAIEGEGGVPSSFYIKHLTKNDIAKAYIKRFYPNGLKSAEDRRKGTIGISSEEEE